MTGLLLDVSDFPHDREYVLRDGAVINLRELVEDLKPVVEVLELAGMAIPSSSIGFAMTYPARQMMDIAWKWHDPHTIVWFVGGWGPDKYRYIANAVRKIRPLLRYIYCKGSPNGSFSTLDFRLHLPGNFEEGVSSVDDDGNYPWGDFPWGGAVYRQVGDTKLLCGVSGLTEVQDDIVANLFLGALAQRITIGDSML